jgi:hypothetical protein
MPPVRQYQSNFFTTTQRFRLFPRYLRQPMNHRARKYGIPNVQPRRAKFLPGNPQLRPYPRYPHQKALDRTPNNPPPLKPAHQSEEGHIELRIIKRIHSLFNWIIKIVQFVQSRIHEQSGAYCGCASSCICMAVITATTAVAVGTALSIRLGVGLDSGLKNNNESMNSTLTGNNYTYINIEGF